MASNPIQQRINQVCIKWEDAKKYKGARCVRILCQPDELDMVDTFYTYMIGSETPVADIAFLFDSDCIQPKNFSRLLLKELEETMEVWSNSTKDERIEYTPVVWKAESNYASDQNTAALFVKNFNQLADAMNIPDDYYAVAVFRNINNQAEFAAWIEKALECGIGKNVKFLFHDVAGMNFYNHLSAKAGNAMATIPVNLNMAKAMEQCAAMGDPKDPATEYRVHFTKMMNALGKNNESEAEAQGWKCLEIANRNLSKDPNWISQLIVVYTALGNDKFRNKKQGEALEYANKAVDTAHTAQTVFENAAAEILKAQALMFRATISFMSNHFGEAAADYAGAYEIYLKTGNTHLTIEACRMTGKSAIKSGLKDNAVKIMAEGLKVFKDYDKEIATSSTLPYLILQLLDTNHETFISSEEISTIAGKFYGTQWRSVLKNWKENPQAVQKNQPPLTVS